MPTKYPTCSVTPAYCKRHLVTVDSIIWLPAAHYGNGEMTEALTCDLDAMLSGFCPRSFAALFGRSHAQLAVEMRKAIGPRRRRQPSGPELDKEKRAFSRYAAAHGLNGYLIRTNDRRGDSYYYLPDLSGLPRILERCARQTKKRP